MKYNNIFYRCLNGLFFVILVMSLYGCKKYLSAKSSKSLVIPNTLVDLQGLFDAYNFVNNTAVGAGMAAADEYSLNDNQYSGLSREEYRNMYIWADSNLFVTANNGWNYAYDNIYRANTVLENITNIQRDASNYKDWDNVKGQALFLRGRCFFEIAMIWAEAYDEKTSNVKLGIPLRLGTDFNVASVRSSVEESYNQIVSDLRSSIELLPVTPVHVYRASMPAACGELARVYLAMRKYDSAYYYTDKALGEFNMLLDYNSLDTNTTYPFTMFEGEAIYVTTLIGTFSPYNYVDSSIYNMFDKNDLRKQLFFTANSDGTQKFTGSYNKTFQMFGGIASDELYLMRAECSAKMGNTQAALDDINLLLKNRYKSGTYVVKSSNNVDTVLNFIRNERLKELVFRGLRWIDIKRFNKEGANITLRRIIADKVYTLPPNDLRYAMAIPQDIIDHSKIEQNPR